uniref:non-specific serine/threonine protein kinase n=1 Tax=Nelumbo nucifera TaxID=4432 RepID=A0A822ZMF7_NELNU|nr:TPA_asm: hypothetical protein HUJ06_003900 [Nelumbo nucifera]
MGFAKSIGKYQLSRTIGEGTFAKVKLALNTSTDQYVAIKIIDKQMVMENKLMEQVKREISTMKLLNHPNIVRIHEVIATKTKIYIVMEYVSGGQLSDKLSYLKKLSEQEARLYFQQLIDAVEYCHCRGVYHRDLKPENLLLDTKGNLKISDFGLSALRKPGDLLSTACGSPCYVAPEGKDNEMGIPKSPSFINAFRLIAMSNDLDLSGLFEEQDEEKQKIRLGSRHPIHETIEKIKYAAKDASLSVEGIYNSKVRIHQKQKMTRCSRSYFNLSAEVIEVTPTHCVVEISKSAGELRGYKEFCKSLSSLLTDKPGDSDEPKVSTDTSFAEKNDQENGSSEEEGSNRGTKELCGYSSS